LKQSQKVLLKQGIEEGYIWPETFLLCLH